MSDEPAQPKLILFMSMSLDGFIAGPEDGPGNGLGNDGERLHAWLGEPDGGAPPRFQPPGRSGEVFDEILTTGAVIVGRRTFDLAGRWNGDHHGVPIFVPTRAKPPSRRRAWSTTSPTASRPPCARPRRPPARRT